MNSWKILKKMKVLFYFFKLIVKIILPLYMWYTFLYFLIILKKRFGEKAAFKEITSPWWRWVYWGPSSIEKEKERCWKKRNWLYFELLVNISFLIHFHILSSGDSRSRTKKKKGELKNFYRFQMRNEKVLKIKLFYLIWINFNDASKF